MRPFLGQFEAREALGLYAGRCLPSAGRRHSSSQPAISASSNITKCPTFSDGIRRSCTSRRRWRTLTPRRRPTRRCASAVEAGLARRRAPGRSSSTWCFLLVRFRRFARRLPGDHQRAVIALRAPEELVTPTTGAPKPLRGTKISKKFPRPSPTAAPPWSATRQRRP